MVAEGEKFAAEDQLHKKRTEALNGLQGFISGLKTQLADKDSNGMAAKLSKADKKKLQEILKEGSEWVDENGRDASLEDLEEKLAELQTGVNPITSKLYANKGGDDDGDDYPDHNEL